MAFQSCCGRYSLRTGCLAIGIFGLLLDLIAFIMGFHWGNLIIDVISNALLIAGAAKGKHLIILPALIIEILGNITIWILALICIFKPSLLRKIGVEDIPQGSVLAGVVIFLLLVAVIQAILIKVVYDHYNELRAERKRAVRSNAEP